MADLIERLIGNHSTRPRIPVQEFLGILTEQARGQLSVSEADAAVAFISNGVGLNPAERAEALAIVNSVTAFAGSTALAKADRALRVDEIESILAFAGVPPYDDPGRVRTRLGIPQ